MVKFSLRQQFYFESKLDFLNSKIFSLCTVRKLLDFKFYDIDKKKLT